MQYEGLHALCFSCGRYGHISSVCPSATTPNQTETPSEGTTVPPVPLHDPQLPKKTALDQLLDGGGEKDYGEWMAATKSRRRQGRRSSTTEVGGGSQTVAGGSKIPSTTKQAVNQPPAVSAPLKSTVKQPPNASASSGSRFDVLLDLDSEEGGGSAPEEEGIGEAGKSNESNVHKTAKPLADLGHMKGKDKGKSVATAASNDSILSNLQPLKQDQTTKKKQQLHSNLKAMDGPVGVLKDMTNLPARQIGKNFETGPVMGQHFEHSNLAEKAQAAISTNSNFTNGSDHLKGGQFSGRPPDPTHIDTPSQNLDPQFTAAAVPTENGDSTIEDATIEDAEENIEVDLCGEEEDPQMVTDG